MKGKLACFVAAILLLVTAGVVILVLALVEGKRALPGSEIVFFVLASLIPRLKRRVGLSPAL